MLTPGAPAPRYLPSAPGRDGARQIGGVEALERRGADHRDGYGSKSERDQRIVCAIVVFDVEGRERHAFA